MVKNITVVKNSKDHYDLCLKYYGSRSYISFDVDNLIVPPLLTSLPGSGNSWIRLLLEYSTGYYSGSIYGDPTLTEIFAGEIHCGKRMVVIKAHPSNLILESKHELGHILFSDKISTELCKKGMIKGFDRMLLLIRDPWNSIFSEFTRRQSSKKVGIRLHNSTLTKSSFQETNWIRQSMMQAFEANEFWNKQYKDFKNILSSNMVVFKYEDLLEKSTRIENLRKMIKFINIKQEIDDERLECAFLLSDNPVIHRNRSSEITINDAYSDERLACQLQIEFEKIKVYQDFGYNLKWKNTDCSKVSPYIHNNIGNWIYAVNGSIFEVVLKSGKTEFLKRCRYGADPRNKNWSILICNPDVLPFIG